MLDRFLAALGAKRQKKKTDEGEGEELSRFVLTCGLKQYGVHLGRPKNPMREDDDPRLFWLEQPDRPPNFYYEQQRILEKAANEAGNRWSWTVTYPQDVIGFARANFMNLATSLGLYCAVSKELGRAGSSSGGSSSSSELIFPGNKTNYLAFNDWTSARAHAEFCLWAVAAPQARDQRFNVTNGDIQSWQDLWPRLARRFGCRVPENMFPGSGSGAGADDGHRKPYPGYEPAHMKLHPRPPISEVEAELGLKGEFSGGRPSEVFCQIGPEAWARRPEVVAAWERLRDRHGLRQEAWDKATWGFLTFLLGREYSCVASMSKARKAGYRGYADTWDEFQATFRELEAAKMLPPVADLKGSHS
ncbi:hypothetical protein GGR56DRAFT_639100 [Xylariaceae sp. FL0804]|nr:hypothetical protein GGR56DRAFT_639100 [Xylariaceae sp. FL0804]